MIAHLSTVLFLLLVVVVAASAFLSPVEISGRCTRRHPRFAAARGNKDGIVAAERRAASSTSESAEEDGRSSKVAAPAPAPAEVSAPAVGRRQWFRSTTVAAIVAVAAASSAAAQENGVGSCPGGSKNCIVTTRTPPATAKPADAVAALKQAIESYPQEGQAGVDLGGWKVAEPGFLGGGGGGVARIEYTSGIGNFAKFFNGGKPFVDDVWLQVADDGAVNVRSSSRVGDSDLGVNQKRLQFLAGELRSKGWDAPEPSY
jgi:hypothetical protein